MSTSVNISVMHGINYFFTHPVEYGATLPCIDVCWNILCRVQPDDIGAHINVGRTFNSLQLFSEAEQAYRTALALLPPVKPGFRLWILIIIWVFSSLQLYSKADQAYCEGSYLCLNTMSANNNTTRDIKHMCIKQPMNTAIRTVVIVKTTINVTLTKVTCCI